MNRQIIQDLIKTGCEIKENFPMSSYTTLKVGGVAGVVIYPESYEKLIETFNILHSYNTEFNILGAGSNTIIRDKGINGYVISTKKLRKFTVTEDNRVIAECGAMLSAIMYKTIRMGLSGFQFAAGIPGTVGGGIHMNAGANGGEIKDVVEKIFVWKDGSELIFNRDEITFEYRKNDLPPGSVVTKAMFKLEEGDSSKLERDVKTYLTHRNKTQPVNLANTGSIFKNPAQIPAGKLIEELGLKGHRVGGAMFSPLHGNFIVNSGEAHASEVIDLINIAKKQARETRGIELETEVKIIGDDE